MFDEQKADEICGYIAGGLSMRKACAKAGQDRSVVYDWLANVPAFADRYARVDQTRAAFHADDIEDVLDDVRAGSLEPNAARVIVDAKKWVASKLHAKRYGDRINLEHSGSIDLSATLVEARTRAAKAK